MSSKAVVKTFFDQATFTYTHVLHDPETMQAAIFDSVLNYDPKSGRTDTQSADEVIAYVQDAGLTLQWQLETHVHADHLSAAPYIKQKLGGKVAIGDHITIVQETFKSIFNAEESFSTDGSQFDVKLSEGDTFSIGNLQAYVMHTPGHTPACSTYVVENELAFVGDTLFMPDQGTARCDFPGGDANTLFNSIHRILQLPDDTKLYMCHDYAPNGREYKYLTTVKEQREANIHVNQNISLQEFVKMRTERDATLAMPVLILPSVQINMRAGEMPPAEDNGTRYLKIPLNVL
ncbi:MBL fold metallo-hydrolase [Reinekea marinisedimentorum]|uniref:Glyoxylase-like metal-dependent hydrolase (Beta-lactamase superfamily II) n=1 Tax=Reinekea marinisedimentorum TaxID=230495 RepID=A0A4R3I892_9GAMM|nr:MBL fold metallo-hydrolase [Reinekea marinisedimentorum]TCS42041.1 glyoxylase-like metal-dependent hydrolase (beta-lactamase superfamily II) [Reinekea marinisedimentorum]